MSEGDLIDIGSNKHLIECQHCQKQTVHHCPGDMILFAAAKCSHCGREFLIALNKPRLNP
jgi:transcription elongation factor Elf1